MLPPDPNLQQRFEILSRRWWPEMTRLIEHVVGGVTTEGTLLHQMVRYHQATGGKRLRAIVPILIAEALGTDPRRVVPFGAACEMLHNASLVHDDAQDTAM